MGTTEIIGIIKGLYIGGVPWHITNHDYRVVLLGVAMLLKRVVRHALQMDGVHSRWARSKTNTDLGLRGRRRLKGSSRTRKLLLQGLNKYQDYIGVILG